MLLTLGILSFILGFALLLLAALFTGLNVFLNATGVILKIAGILMFGPVIIVLLIGAFALILSLFGFVLLF